MLPPVQTDFSSNAHAAIGRYPRLVGKQFKELHALFPCEPCIAIS